MSQYVRLFICLMLVFSWVGADETRDIEESNTSWSLEASSTSEPIKASLISEITTLQNQQTFWVAVKFDIAEHWHTYWKNPGQTGMPISIDWNLPQGFKIGKTEWSYPKMFQQDGVVGYGYEKEAYYLAQIIPPSTLINAKNVTLKADLRWVACSNENCMPGSQEVEVNLPLSPASGEAGLNLTGFNHILSKMPHERWEVRATKKNDLIVLNIHLPKDYPHRFIKGYFFPEKEGAVDPQIEPILTRQENPENYVVVLKTLEGDLLTDQELKGVLVLNSEFSQGIEEALLVSIPWKKELDHELVGMGPSLKTEIRSLSVQDSVNSNEFEGGFWLAMVFAFIGGFILNLMPCVLPVVSFKILSFVKMAGQDRKKTFKHGVAFSSGVLISFWVLASVLLSLQAYGKSVGWGFQLQEPIFVAILAAVLLVFGLSLFGVLEIGTSLISLANNQSHKKEESLSESFFGGVLATAVATPCTGPFLGSAVGFAITLSPILAMLIFTSLGLGMAFPYLALSAYPSLLKFMPKPGKWMVSFKELMGFMMLTTVLWLVWVFSAETSSTALCFLLAAFLILGFGCWAYGKWAAPYRSGKSRVIGKLVAIGCAVVSLYIIYQASSPALADSPKETLAYQEWEEFSAERLQALKEEGRPVFIDFTAKWCLICQANKIALNHEKVSDRFNQLGVVRIRADWTKNDPAITQELKKYGRNGVPLYVLLNTNSETGSHILPQVLTPDVVLNYLDHLEAKVVAEK